MWRPNACFDDRADPAHAPGRHADRAPGPTRDTARPRAAAGRALRQPRDVAQRVADRALRRDARAAAGRGPAPGRHAESATVVEAVRSRRVHRKSAPAHDHRRGNVVPVPTSHLRSPLAPKNPQTKPNAKPKRTILVLAKKRAARTLRLDTPTETATSALNIAHLAVLHAAMIPLNGTIFKSARSTTSIFACGTLIIVTRVQKNTCMPSPL